MSDPNKKEFAIPLLPCNSIDEILEFYLALGFTITYQQKRPNTYVALKIRDLEIHFFVIKALKPENNYSTCYLVVHEIDTMYQSFTTGIKGLMGKLPVKGVPRINPLKDMPSNGVRQFIVVDPSGNYIRIGQPIPKVDSLVYTENNKNANHTGTPLEKAYEIGSRLADAKGDFEAAAKVLDKALETNDGSDADNLFKVLILRTDVAIRMEDYQMANNFIEKINNLTPEIDNKALKDELRLYEELKAILADIF